MHAMRVLRTPAKRLLLGLAAIAVLGGLGAVLVGNPFSDEVPPVPKPGAVAGLTFSPGIQAGPSAQDARFSARLEAPVARVELPIESPAAEIQQAVARYAAVGVRVIPLAGFEGRIPSVADARNVGAWAAAVGPGAAMWKDSDPALAVSEIEFGNETSYVYQGTQERGGDYARRVRTAAQAVAAANPKVGLLVQADNANQSEGWIDQMYDAVPDIHRYAAGWTVHPYGPDWERRVDILMARTADRGAPTSMPIDITEYGLATDDGRCLTKNYGWSRCMTYAQAARKLTDQVGAIRRYLGGRLRYFIVYNNRDLRPSQSAAPDAEYYFGALTEDGSPKGAYTSAVERVLAIRVR